MFPLLYRNLRHKLTIIRRPTSHILFLHFNVFNSDVIVHNLHQNNPLLKSISDISKSTKQQQPSFTVDYLVNSCGLPPERAHSAAKRFNLCSIEKADSVISFFQNYGFSKTHITKIISQRPHILTVDLNKYLKPKFEFLSALGISGTDLSKFLSTSVTFLGASLQNQIIPSFDFIKRFIGTNADIVVLLKRWPCIISVNLEKLLIPNISILQVHGVPDDNIRKMFIENPRSLGRLNSIRFKETVEKVKKLGFDVESTLFCRAVHIIASLSKSSWDKKLMVYGEFGLLENDVISAFKKQPQCMQLSEDKIRRALNFFLKKLKCKPADISFYPALLLYSLEKRITPRCAVLKILYSKGIISNKLSLGTVFTISEKDFSEKFVLKYQETVPEVMSAYRVGVEFEGFGEVVEVKDCYMEPVIDHIPPVVTAV